MVTKKISLSASSENLALCEDSPLFSLSIILEEYVSEHDDSDVAKFAQRLDEFIWSSESSFTE